MLHNNTTIKVIDNNHILYNCTGKIIESIFPKPDVGIYEVEFKTTIIIDNVIMSTKEAFLEGTDYRTYLYPHQIIEYLQPLTQWKANNLTIPNNTSIPFNGYAIATMKGIDAVHNIEIWTTDGPIPNHPHYIIIVQSLQALSYTMSLIAPPDCWIVI